MLGRLPGRRNVDPLTYRKRNQRNLRQYLLLFSFMFGMCPTQPRTIPFLLSSHNLPTVPSCPCVPTVRPYVIFAPSYFTRLFSCTHAKSCLGAVPYQLHFPRSHVWFPSSASDLPKIKPRLHPRSLPVFSSLFHFRRPPFPGQLFFTTIFMKTHFRARFSRRPLL